MWKSEYMYDNVIPATVTSVEYLWETLFLKKPAKNPLVLNS